jgi:hypothetical protein
VSLLLLACEVACLRREDLATAFNYLQLALAARTLTATSRRQEDSVLGKSTEQSTAGSNLDLILTVNLNLDISARQKETLCHKQNHNQREDDYKEDCYT